MRLQFNCSKPDTEKNCKLDMRVAEMICQLIQVHFIPSLHTQVSCRHKTELKTWVCCLSLIILSRGSTRNYLKPKRKTNKQMQGFVKVCLMPIDQLPRIASVSQKNSLKLQALDVLLI